MHYFFLAFNVEDQLNTDWRGGFHSVTVKNSGVYILFTSQAGTFIQINQYVYHGATIVCEFWWKKIGLS